MRRKIARFILIAVASIGLTSAGVARSESKIKELPNFHQINEQLYRGAQPKRDGIQRLAQLGIKTILNLRDDDERARSEKEETLAAGLRYFNIPFKNLGKPSDEQVRHVLGIINDPQNQPVFVHCKRGADRTGMVVAIYRIEHDGWSSERAKAEAKQYGMAFWQRGMKDYIRDYYQRTLQRGATVLRPSAGRNSKPSLRVESQGETLLPPTGLYIFSELLFSS